MEKENLSNGVLPLKGCNPLSTLYVIGNGFDVALMALNPDIMISVISKKRKITEDL